MTKPPTRPFPAIVNDIFANMMFKDKSIAQMSKIPKSELIKGDEALAAILQAVRQWIDDAMPEKEKVPPIVASGENIRKLGYNQALDEYRSKLLEGLEMGEK